MRRLFVLCVLLCPSLVVAASTFRGHIHFRESVVFEETLDACHILVCTGKKSCVPQQRLQTIESVHGEGGEDYAAQGCTGPCEHPPIPVTVPRPRNHKRVCFAVECTTLLGELSPRSAVLCR